MKRKALHVLGIMIMITATLMPSRSFAAGHTVSISSTPVSCNSACNGAATANVTGGIGPFSYSWAPGGQVTSSITGLCAGNYTVTVTDGNDMSTATATVTITQPMPLTVTASSTPSCAASCTGTAAATVSGGTAPYAYLWNNSITTPTSSGLCSGTYTVMVTDMSGCVVSNTVTIGSYPAINPSITMSDDTICVGATSQFTVSSNGGLTYSWSPASTLSSANTVNPVAAPMITTTYTVVVTDGNGCPEVASATLYVDDVTPVISPSSPFICLGSSVTLTASSPSSISNPSYYWGPALNLTSPNATVTPTVTTTYTIVATSPAGCMQNTTVTVTVLPVPTVTTTSTIASCAQSDGTATAIATGSTAPYLFQWNTAPVQTTYIATGLPAGNYAIDVTDANGCTTQGTVTVIDSCGFVWPGDADEDLVSDNNDVLAIGLAYGATGPVRPGATTSWIGQNASAWGTSLPNGADYKYADCNGDGVIDNNDTAAISLNYGNTHSFRLGSPEILMTNPNIYLVANADSAGVQTLVTVDVMMGTSAMPIDSLYGVAFTLSFDPMLVDSTMTSMDYTGSWMGTSGVNMLPFSKSMHAAGIIDVAIVGTDHQNRVGGQGKIATLRIVTTDNLSGLSVLPVNISNVNALRLSGNNIQLNAIGDSIVIDPAITGIRAIDLDKLVSLYPNPASSSATLVIPGNISGTIHIVDLTGRNIMSIDQPAAITHIDLSQIPSGIYQLIIQTPHGNVNRKLNVIH